MELSDPERDYSVRLSPYVTFENIQQSYFIESDTLLLAQVSVSFPLRRYTNGTGGCSETLGS